MVMAILVLLPSLMLLMTNLHLFYNSNIGDSSAFSLSDAIKLIWNLGGNKICDSRADGSLTCLKSIPHLLV